MSSVEHGGTFDTGGDFLATSPQVCVEDALEPLADQLRARLVRAAAEAGEEAAGAVRELVAEFAGALR